MLESFSQVVVSLFTANPTIRPGHRRFDFSSSLLISIEKWMMSNGSCLSFSRHLDSKANSWAWVSIAKLRQFIGKQKMAKKYFSTEFFFTWCTFTSTREREWNIILTLALLTPIHVKPKQTCFTKSKCSNYHYDLVLHCERRSMNNIKNSRWKHFKHMNYHVFQHSPIS